jgi:protease I
MSNELQGKRIAFLVANQGVEQVELTSPWQAVKDAGGEAVLIAPEKESVQAVNGDIEKGDTFDPDLAVGDASADDFDALVLAVDARRSRRRAGQDAYQLAQSSDRHPQRRR